MNKTEQIRAGLQRRQRRETRFRFCGLGAVLIGFFFLLYLMTDLTIKAIPAFSQSWIRLTITYDAERLGLRSTDDMAGGNFRGLLKSALGKSFPKVRKRRAKRELLQLISTDAEYQLQNRLIKHPEFLNQSKSLWLQADDEVDLYLQSATRQASRLSLRQRAWVDELQTTGRIERRFNWQFFSHGDSREPEQAGIAGALMGSLYTLVITLMLSFPISVAAAIYLEEFAPKNRWTDFIEVNVNNLAAVPSIVFGLLGLAVFINFFGLPRSAPLVGGIVLSLMTLPTIIIASRAALKSVPPSLREAALGLGASKMQVVFHHVLPLSMPGILTGTILGMSQALGETAPLLMIGMVAFIVDVPHSFTDSATVLPVQIFLWADSPERAFLARTSAAIVVLLAFLITMNASAIWLRKKLERRW